MAAGSLLAALYFSGSRLSDGTPNQSGQLWAYLPSTISPVNLYTDATLTSVATQPITLDNGGRIPYSTYPNGLWVIQPIRLLVQDVNGATVSDATFTPATADNVSVGNVGFSGDTVDDVLDAAFASTKGIDFQYLESGGATPRLIHDKFQEQGISVKDFGAVGNGIAIDTTAIQSAANEAKALSTGLIFPAGTYKIDQAIVVSSATGLFVVGQGSNATTIKQTNSSANTFTFTSCTSLNLRGLGLNHASTTTGSAISATSCTSVIGADISTNSNTFAVGYNSVGGNTATFYNCFFRGSGAGNTARGLKSSTPFLSMYGGSLISASGDSSDVALELFGTAADTTIVGVSFSGSAVGIRFTAGLTGNRFTVVGCQGLGTLTTPLDQSSLTNDPLFRQWANQLDGSTANITSGSSFTPNRALGPTLRIRATSTGGAFTINPPIPVPLGMRDVKYKLAFYNNAGAPITGWTMDANYHLSAGPSTTDGQITSYLLEYDSDASVWRELSRSVTT